jgi:hypothetical protein
LIAASPELLEACQAVIASYEDGRSIASDYELREQCRAAIAKATPNPEPAGEGRHEILAILDAPNARTTEGRQRNILTWVHQAFGVDGVEQRALRMLEEAVELYQAAGGNAAQAGKLVAFVFARPVGELAQEIGGLGLTLEALAETAGLSADVESSREFGRVLQKPLAHFTARNEAKNAAGFKADARTTEGEVACPVCAVCDHDHPTHACKCDTPFSCPVHEGDAPPKAEEPAARYEDVYGNSGTAHHEGNHG